MPMARRVRPCRIRVQHSASGQDIFCIPVGPMVEGERPDAQTAAWAEGWFCTWVSLPDLLDEAGPFCLVVEACSAAIPLELARDPELHAPLMQATFRRDGLDLGKLGGLVLGYVKKSRAPQAVDIPL